MLAFDEAVAAWARRARRIGSNMVFSPLAVGPADLPEIGSVADAMAHPERSMLTALARLGARDPCEIARHQAEVVRVFEAMMRTRDAHARRVYLSLLHGTAKGALRGILERLLEEHDMGALEMIRAEGKAEGIAVGKAEGIAVGKAEGIAVGEALALLTVMRARGIRVDTAAETLIRETLDRELLDRWLARALEATSVDDVLAG